MEKVQECDASFEDSEGDEASKDASHQNLSSKINHYVSDFNCTKQLNHNNATPFIPQ